MAIIIHSSPALTSGTCTPHVTFTSVGQPDRGTPSLDPLPTAVVSTPKPLLRLHCTVRLGDLPSRRLHTQRPVTPRERRREAGEAPTKKTR